VRQCFVHWNTCNESQRLTSLVSRLQYFLHLEVFGLEIIRFNIENDATVNSCCNKLMQA
jgi:hypothetical protein